jgi:hypothetical protein
MKRWTVVITLVAVSVCVMATTSGCVMKGGGTTVVRGSTFTVPDTWTPDPKPTAADEKVIAQVMEPHSLDASGQPEMPAERLHDLVEARAKYADALIPADTLGRRLAAVIYMHTTNPRLEPTRSLVLVYAGGLTVRQALFERRAGDLGIRPVGEATTTANGASGTVSQLGGRVDGKYVMFVEWRIEKTTYTVYAPDLSAPDAVRIARSMSASVAVPPRGALVP